MVRDRIPPCLGCFAERAQNASWKRPYGSFGLRAHLQMRPPVHRWLMAGQFYNAVPSCLSAHYWLTDRNQIIARKWKLEARPWPQGGFWGGRVNCMFLHHPSIGFQVLGEKCKLEGSWVFLALPDSISTKPFMPGTNMYWSSIMCFYYVAGNQARC